MAKNYTYFKHGSKENLVPLNKICPTFCAFESLLTRKSIRFVAFCPEPQEYYFIGNKAKGRISKRVFQENKTRQIFRKTNISYPLMRTRTCAYQGVRNVHFSEIFTCFVFLKHPF